MHLSRSANSFPRGDLLKGSGGEHRERIPGGGLRHPRSLGARDRGHLHLWFGNTLGSGPPATLNCGSEIPWDQGHPPMSRWERRVLLGLRYSWAMLRAQFLCPFWFTLLLTVFGCVSSSVHAFGQDDDITVLTLARVGA